MLKRAPLYLATPKRSPNKRAKYTKKSTSDVKRASTGATTLVRGPRRAELKRNYQLPISGIALSNTWQMFPFGEVPNGSDMYTRDGRAIKHQYTQWALRLTKNPAYNQTQVRMILLAWKQALATPVTTDVITDPSGVLATDAMYQIDHSDQYVILEDKIFDLTSGAQAIGGAAFGECIKTFDGVISYPRIQTYTDTGLTDVANWRYYVMVVSQFAASISDIRFQAASTFVDI